MFHHHFGLLFFIIISTQGHVQATINSSCDDSVKICENIWYCKEGSYPDNYTACGQDGLVDRVCCEPKYKQTKSRRYCNSLYKRVQIDEYGNKDTNSIVGFRDILTKDIPHTAALGIRDGSQTNWTCAGSLISDKYIITAAKCLNRKLNIVRLGDLDLNKDDDNVGPQEYGILKYIIHPKYNAATVYNDLALIELNNTITITEFVKPVCLHDEKKLREFAWEEAGYKETGMLDILTTVVLMESPKRACNIYFDSKRFANRIPFGLDENTQLCGSSIALNDVCQADNGGPLHLRDFNYIDARFLAGVTTIPKPCSKTNEPGLYTRISHYVPWIESIVFPDN